MNQITQTFKPYVEVVGDGDPIVLVHGGWVDGARWASVAPEFARANTVATYDRRGHSRSVWSGAVARRTDEDDLARLIEELDLGPAHVVGNSYGASIVLGAVARYPHLIRSVAADEPPLVGVAEFAPTLAPELDSFSNIVSEIAQEIERGGAERAAARFVEEVAFGPGAWSMIADDVKSTMVTNAPTLVGMLEDVAWGEVPAAPAADIPVLLTDGGRSPAWLRNIVTALANGPYRRARHATVAEAGHIPHVTHPAEFVAVIRDFIATS